MCVCVYGRILVRENFKLLMDCICFLAQEIHDEKGMYGGGGSSGSERKIPYHRLDSRSTGRVIVFSYATLDVGRSGWAHFLLEYIATTVLVFFFLHKLHCLIVQRIFFWRATQSRQKFREVKELTFKATPEALPF